MNMYPGIKPKHQSCILSIEDEVAASQEHLARRRHRDRTLDHWPQSNLIWPKGGDSQTQSQVLELLEPVLYGRELLLSNVWQTTIIRTNID